MHVHDRDRLKSYLCASQMWAEWMIFANNWNFTLETNRGYWMDWPSVSNLKMLMKHWEFLIDCEKNSHNLERIYRGAAYILKIDKTFNRTRDTQIENVKKTTNFPIDKKFHGVFFCHFQVKIQFQWWYITLSLSMPFSRLNDLHE